MSRTRKIGILIAVVVALAAGAMIGINLSQPVAAQGAAKDAHYSVVGTDGTHLIVTDNKTNTLYFYSIEKDAEIGSPLKLRGSVDLTQVGKDVLTPVVLFKKKS